MNRERLEQLIARFPTRRIAVIGDFFLDKYLDTDPRIAEHSVESGKTAHQVVRIRRSPGVAGTVVNNLAALGTGTLHAVGAIGDDGEAFDLRRCLEERGCTVEALLSFAELMTPTYLKPRDITDPSLAGEHERYDTKNRRPTPEPVVRAVLEQLDRLLPDLDAVVVADQVEEDECGVITSQVRAALSERAQRFPKVIFWVDSRTHIHAFRNLIIKPNQFEAVGFPNPRPEDRIDDDRLLQALPRLRERAQAPVVITAGERGMFVSDPQPTHVPGVHLEGPIDPTGAGDSSTAGAVLALASGAELTEAALVGNLVASITVQQLATTGTATPEQLLDRLELWRSQHPEHPLAD